MTPTAMLLRIIKTWDFLFTVLTRSRGRPGFAWGIALFAGALAAGAQGQTFVTEVTAPAPGTYDRTLALHFTARFSAPVIVEGAPRLALRVGERVRHASYTPPLGTVRASDAITFVYHPDPLDNDEDGITVVPELDLNGGTIQGLDTSPVRLGFASPETRGVLVTLLPPPTPRIIGLSQPERAATPAPELENAFALRGTADAGSRVRVELVEVGVVGSTVTTTNGAWSMPYPTSLLSPGTHRVVVTAENSDGLISAPSAPLDLRVSTPPPAR